ncbi:MAG: PD-(D/E)XK nuclease family protein [Lachnospiraceae bacterium]|nr:PD-(D/E)XK nuclease family protein [Lachnospiraceae bacterium]
MNIENAKQLSYESIRKMYKTYLEGQELGRNTVQTMSGDTFYLWNNVGRDEFWEAVTSNDFETDAKEALLKALTDNSTGNVSSLVNGYLATLRKFRNYVYSDDIDVPELDGTKALKDFLLDIECLDSLSEWTGKFNLFDILRITRTEIRHSNMLAWLLSPNENHGLSDSVIRGFIHHVVTPFSEVADVFDTLLMDCHDFVIQREWHNIDVLAVSVNEKFVLCIENKIDSNEHDNQLNRYRKIVEDTYPGYKKMYIYLSPEGIEASDSEYWCSMSYQDVLKIVENARQKIKLIPEAGLLIDNYIDTIRRDIVGDEKLAEVCAEIYAKHQKALDLIFENRPDKVSNLANIIKAWAIEKTEKGEIEVTLDKCGKLYIRFKTAYMSSIMPDSEEPDSGWSTPNHYFYEIRNIDGKEFFIQLSLSAKNITDHQREVCDRINEHFPSKQQKQNWQWRTPFVTKHSKVDEELSEDKIYEHLDKRLEEVKAFEEKLKGIFAD